MESIHSYDNVYAISNKINSLSCSASLENRVDLSKEYSSKVFVDNIKMNLVPPVKEALFYDPATIVYFEDGTKTVVKKMDGEVYNPEYGFALCLMKRAYGEDYHKLMWKHCWGGQEARRADKRKQSAQKKK